MQQNDRQELVGFIWSIADKLWGPYRPPQYRRVMLPLIVLRRLDCVLESTKDALLAKKAQLEAKGIEGVTLEKALSKAAVGSDRNQPLQVSSFSWMLLAQPSSSFGQSRH